MSDTFTCSGCQNKFPVGEYLHHTKECKGLEALRKNYQIQTESYDLFRPIGPDLDLIGAYIKVIKDLKHKKFCMCRHFNKEIENRCPAICFYADESVSCDEPCILEYLIQNLCDIAQDKVNEEMDR